MNKQSKTVPFARIWLTATFVAVVVGVPSAFFAKNHPWVIAIPIAVGTLAIIIPEILGLLPPTGEQLPLIKMPRGYLGLSRYKGYAAIALTTEDDPDQQIFAFVSTPRNAPGKFPAILKDAHGNDIMVVDAERFVSLVLKQASEDSDKATEASLRIAAHRYGEMHGISPELEQFLRDKTVLEVMKSDFRGNISTNLNRSCEAVIRDLIRRTKTPKTAASQSVES